MKKKTLLTLIIALFCIFTMPKVHADLRVCDPFDKTDAEKNLTGVKLHYTEKKAYSPGEKVYLDLTGVERGNDISIMVLLRSSNGSDKKYYSVYLKNATGSDETGAYFIVPDISDNFPKDEYEIYGLTYYKETDEIKEYGVTPEGERSPIYKVLCTTYFTKQEDADKESNSVFLKDSYGKFTLIDKKAEVENILKEIKLEKNYTYFGGKITFKVTTTKPIRSAYLTFTDRTKSGSLPFFTVNLISDGSGNEFTYTVSAPTYGINNVYEGTYKLEEIQFYGLDNSKYTYNTNKAKAEEYNDKYVDYKLSLTLGKPITDLLKEAKFELKDTKLVKNEAKVGDKVSVNFDYYYNSANLKIQSVMLTFQDETNKTMFSSYLKEIAKDSSIIIPSTAKAGEYTLKTVTITFDSYVGETNTVILNASNIVDAAKKVFEQKLKITDSEDAGLYFIAEELYESSIEKIKAAKENTVVTINANANTIIPAEVFDAIKETSKQVIIEYDKNEWVFSGVDIEKSKPVDVSINYYKPEKLKSAEEIKKAVGNKAVILEFPANGDLPGKTLIRIKNEEIRNQLEGDIYYVYYINELESKLDKVAIEIQKSSDGYIEFYINHNSKYVIKTSEVVDEEVLGKDDSIAKVNAVDSVKIEKGNNTVLYAIIGGCVLVIVILVIALIKKPKKVEVAPPPPAPVVPEEPKEEEPETIESLEEPETLETLDTTPATEVYHSPLLNLQVDPEPAPEAPTEAPSVEAQPEAPAPVEPEVQREAPLEAPTEETTQQDPNNIV